MFIIFLLYDFPLSTSLIIKSWYSTAW